jgi:hypothetical protein
LNHVFDIYFHVKAWDGSDREEWFKYEDTYKCDEPGFTRFGDADGQLQAYPTGSVPQSSSFLIAEIGFGVAAVALLNALKLLAH